MPFADQVQRELIKTLEPFSMSPRSTYAATKLDVLPEKANLIDFKVPPNATPDVVSSVTKFNKYDLGEMVATISHNLPFARVVQGPYIKPNGNLANGPFYTLQDSKGFWQVSGMNIGGIPDDKSHQLSSNDGSVASVALNFGDAGIRYVPLFRALKFLTASILDQSNKVILDNSVSDETREVVREYLKALDVKAQSTHSIYPIGVYRQLGFDELSRLHSAVS